MRNTADTSSHDWLRELLLDLVFYTTENDLKDTDYLLKRTIYALTNDVLKPGSFNENGSEFSAKNKPDSKVVSLFYHQEYDH